YEALYPDAREARRGEIVDEGMRALRLLFTERKASFRGKHVRFQDVECFPKPRQSPLPMYAGGNHPEVRRRAGEYGEGWMPAVLSPEEIARGVQDVRRAADKAGRNAAIDIAPQFACSIGRTHEEAVKRFHSSQLYKHLESLKRSTLREQTGGFEQRNLIGSPAEICERIRVYQQAASPRPRACSSSRTPCPRCRRRSSSSGARAFPTSGESMDAHRRQRLTGVLETEGLDALVATTTENVYYVSGLRSISHALFRGLELYAVFTRRGTALVIPFIDTTGVAADRIEVDHLACYGQFFF